MSIYFCDPASPWQRGSNENANGLLRRYFPKKTNLNVHDPARLLEVAMELNQRPRRTLKGQTPRRPWNGYSQTHQSPLLQRLLETAEVS